MEKLAGAVETTIRVLPPWVKNLSRRMDASREEVKGELRETRAYWENRIGSLEERPAESRLDPISKCRLS
ncbi:hypothetical protein [Thermus amyloliquefaciens]|uniref:hypothetical protein n=1 Tax=Thermus amyloliquefaciens TaxID=1449080 RepID=UPI000B0868E1|nr:hypothetical protein [Thermus amyloliquefaciens]